MKPESCEIYIHIPFCVRKCNYCDFLSFPAGLPDIRAYMNALESEIRLTASHLGSVPAVDTIFIGGGTPSILEPDRIIRLMDVIRETFEVRQGAEISLEANPGTLSREKLSSIYNAGINRLSIGLQSPDDSLLKRLGRIHSREEFLTNYRQAREIGFDNINIDLMSGLPGQSLTGYCEGLREVLALEPDHISSYSLILEEGTPFYENDDIRRILPDEETDRLMYEQTGKILAQHGYRRYEISNYALPGKECRHNLGYWDQVPYLGFGLGASSYYRVSGKMSRFSNEKSLDKYIKSPFRPFVEREDYEVLSRESLMEEYMFLGLRKREGISISGFERAFGRPMDKVYGNVIQAYLREGYLIRQGDRLFLSDQGIDVSDYIFRDFMLV